MTSCRTRPCPQHGRPVGFTPLLRPEPHAGDERYQRRNEDGSFGESDDQTKSLRQDAPQHAKTKKPRGEGDKGD